MVDEITIRQATLTDVFDLVRLRRMMFDAMGWNDPAQLDAGGAVIDQHPPGPGNLSGQIGYIMSLVTDPGYRRRGIAGASCR